MQIPEIVESNVGSVNTITLGATADQGGTRTGTITIGGATSAVFAGTPDNLGHKPVIAMDVVDSPQKDWPDVLIEP